MNSKAKPLPKTGERNIHCPYYDRCLDHAVDHRWDTWSCAKCQHKVAYQSISGWDYEITETVSYYELPLALADIFDNDSID